MKIIINRYINNGISNLLKMIKTMDMWKTFLAISFIGLFFELINVQLLGWGRKWVIDSLAYQNDRLFFMGLALVVAFGLIAPTSIITIDYKIFKYITIAKYDIKRTIIKRFLKSSFGNMDLDSGDILYRINNDIDDVTEIFGITYLCIATIGRTIGAIIIGIKLSWELSLIIIIFGIIKLIVEKYVLKKLYNILNEIKEIEATFVDDLYKMLMGNVYVRIFGNIRRFRQNFNRLTDKYNASNIKEANIDAKVKVINWLLNIVSLIVILILGGTFVLYGKITIGTLVVFLGIQGALLDPYRYIGNLIKQYSHSYTSFKRLEDISTESVKSNQDKDYVDQKVKLDRFELVANNLTFKYEPEKIIFSNLSFRAKSGEITYIVGKSGAGKTTLFKVLMGLFEYEDGNVYIEDNKNKCLRLEKKLITYISQNNFVFNGTIKENIAFSRHGNEEYIIEASKKAGIYDYVMSLPDNFNTVIYDNGKLMSGGQRSRLCLARAFYRNSPIILMDEIFASLDNKTIKYILKSIESKLDKNTCILMITHRGEHIPDGSEVIGI